MVFETNCGFGDGRRVSYLRDMVVTDLPGVQRLEDPISSLDRILVKPRYLED